MTEDRGYQALRHLARQVITDDSQQQGFKRRLAFFLDLGLFVILLPQASSLLILWGIGLAGHFYAAFPTLFSGKRQSPVAQEYSKRQSARRALERLRVGIPDDKIKTDEAIHVLEDGELS